MSDLTITARFAQRGVFGNCGRAPAFWPERYTGCRLLYLRDESSSAASRRKITILFRKRSMTIGERELGSKKDGIKHRTFVQVVQSAFEG
jgi:hypothetical protein